DPEWIPYCAAEGLIIVTGDKGIELDPVNIHSVVKSKAKILMLDENCSKAATWASAIIVSQISIAEETAKDGPLIVSLRNNGTLTHSWRSPSVQSTMFDKRAIGEVEI